jgi:Flp pilus assembly secretin CpaC
MSQTRNHKRRYSVGVGLAIALSLPAMVHAEEVLVTFPSSLAASPYIGPGATETMALVVDFAVVMQIDGDIGSIVLGNAAIADAIVADGTTIVLTGKSAGMTNMIVLDTSNQIVAQMTVRVSGRKPGTVTVRRALEMQSYGCSSGLCTGSTDEVTDVSADLTTAPL